MQWKFWQIWILSLTVWDWDRIFPTTKEAGIWNTQDGKYGAMALSSRGTKLLRKTIFPNQEWQDNDDLQREGKQRRVVRLGGIQEEREEEEVDEEEGKEEGGGGSEGGRRRKRQRRKKKKEEGDVVVK